MNPHSYNNFNTSFNLNQRDKIKSHLQPNTQNSFISSYVTSNVIPSSSSLQPSQKFKSYYNQYQDYRQPSISQLQPNYSNIESQRNNIQRSNVFIQNKFSTTSPVNFYPAPYQRHTQKSEQRKRFYTTTGIQRSNTHFTVGGGNNQKNQHINQDNKFSHSMVYSNNPPAQSQRNSITKDQINPKKDLFKFVTHKFSASRIQSTFNSRQKKPDLNKSEYLQKANKKISLKRDIAVTSPRNSIQDNKFANIIQKKDQSIFNRQKTTSFFESNVGNQQKMAKQDNLNSNRNLQRYSSSSGSQVSQYKQPKQPSFKKNQQHNTYEVTTDLPSSQFSSNNQVFSPSTSRGTGQTFFGTIKANKLPINNKNPSTQGIDPQIYADMKISRIQQSTSNLQQKIQKIIKTIQTISHNSKQHQNSLNQINQYISKQQQQGITPHDIKRIKKQLKIMKTNFQTAFTSMTDQINRKLIKQQNIMKSLSEEIKSVAEQNQRFGDILQKKSKKVQTLQKSMTSFMRQNQERMENIVLNQSSFSSSKRSKNHSFEYGLDLKNMSGEQNYGSNNKQNQNNEGFGKKIETLQREIKKMKIFHIEEQQTYRNKFSQLKEEIERVGVLKQKQPSHKQIQKLLQQLSEGMWSMKLESLSQKISEREDKKLSMIKGQIQRYRVKLQQLNKICHQELYEFRMNKMQGININNNALNTQMNIQSLNNQFQQQLGQIQGKQRSFLLSMSQYQQKLISLQDRQHIIWKNIQDNRIKQIKLGGDIRQVQVYFKDIKIQLSQSKTSRQRLQAQIKQHSIAISQNKGLFSTIEQKLKQLDRINSIQTQNIQSINIQFQRVINREIIPKFGDVHVMMNEISQKVNNLQKQLVSMKRNQTSLSYSNSGYGSGSNSKSNQTKQMQTKIATYFTQNVQRFIKTKVKIVSSRSLLANQPLVNLGLFRKGSQYSIDQDQSNNVQKQQTYLVDQNGYLMDWEGCYLMEIDQLGIKRKIQISQEQVYFMQVNGIEVKNLRQQNR